MLSSGTVVTRQPLTALDYGTELPGLRATGPQLRLAAHRYALVARYSVGKDVLDAACGAGQGLPLLARHARTLIAGDITESNLALARAAAPAIPFIRMDAERLPFRDGSFDLISMLEAIYYLPDPRRVVTEAWRTLRSGGTFIVGSVNPAGRDFGRAPANSTQFFDSRALRQLLGDAGFTVEILAAFPAPRTIVARAVSGVRRISSMLRLPWPMQTRWWIRRALHGSVETHPSSIDEAPGPTASLITVPPSEVDRLHQVLYAVGTKGRR
jgi:SAM-dependent methyltransferase